MDKNNPKFSVVVPVYKVEVCLSECIESLLAQTFTDFELILVDDGSPDKSGAICNAYAEKDSRVRVFHKENGGVSSARNVGIDHARGEYICFFDGDDTVSPKILEEFDKVCQKEVELVICGFSQCDINSKLLGSPAVPRERTDMESIGEFAVSLFSDGVFNAPWNKCFKREFLVSNNLKFKEGIALAEDCIFISQCFQSVKAVATLSKSLYCYRCGVAGSAVSRSYPNIEEIFKDWHCEFCKILGVRRSPQFDRVMQGLVSMLLLDISRPSCRKPLREKLQVIRWGLSFVPSKKATIGMGRLKYTTGSPVLLLAWMKTIGLLSMIKHRILDLIG